MSAWKNVRVEADCRHCDGSGVRFPVRVDLPAMGVVRCCAGCEGSGRVSVPASEWAEALATVQGVEAIRVFQFYAEGASSSGWQEARPGVAINGRAHRRIALVLPASASTREDGQ